MFTSIGDMVRWLQNLTDRKVGDAELFDLFFAGGRLDDGQALRYAAGWVLDRYRGLQAVRHGGMGVGFQSHIAWFPELKIGVAILANARPFKPWPLANDVLDALIGEGPTQQRRSRLREAASLDESAEAVNLSGRYFTAPGTPVLVDRKGDHLVIDTWFERRRFFRQSNGVFKEESFGDTVAFHRNAEGKVTCLTIETEDGACPQMHSPIRTAVKFETTTLGRAELARFEGRYLSNELDTVYTIVAEGDGLIARHLRCDDWHLYPIESCATGTFEGDFAQRSDWPGKVTFERDSNDEVVGFRVRGNRVNLFFHRLPPVVS